MSAYYYFLRLCYVFFLNYKLLIPKANCLWGPWKPTGPKCPEKCGENATRSWERSIEVVSSLCGAPCTGITKKIETCEYIPCPVGKI